MPVIENSSAPTTKPACTPLESSACRTGWMAASRTMSGRIAADVNHRLMPESSARISNRIDRTFDPPRIFALPAQAGNVPDFSGGSNPAGRSRIAAFGMVFEGWIDIDSAGPAR